MKVRIDHALRVHLVDMTFEEAVALRDMIVGAQLPLRRMFNTVKEQIEKPIDELMTWDSASSPFPEQSVHQR